MINVLNKFSFINKVKFNLDLMMCTCLYYSENVTAACKTDIFFNENLNERRMSCIFFFNINFSPLLSTNINLLLIIQYSFKKINFICQLHGNTNLLEKISSIQAHIKSHLTKLIPFYCVHFKKYIKEKLITVQPLLRLFFSELLSRGCFEAVSIYTSHVSDTLRECRERVEGEREREIILGSKLQQRDT